MGELLYADDFSDGMSRWWSEGGERVWASQGGLNVKADPRAPGPGGVCTVWCCRAFPGNLTVEMDARVVHSYIEANNVNFFLSYCGPAGMGLYETREQRSGGDYRFYHDLPGYIFTFLNDRNREGPPSPDGGPCARLRIRRCPGFRLLAETYAYHCREGRSYHLTVSKRESRICLDVDGQVSLEATDPDPLAGGQLGFRTFRSHITWSKLRVTRNDDEMKR